MAERSWTRAMVADRLELAAEVMRSLPPVRPQGYGSTWPEFLQSFADQVEFATWLSGLMTRLGT